MQILCSMALEYAKNFLSKVFCPRIFLLQQVLQNQFQLSHPSTRLNRIWHDLLYDSCGTALSGASNEVTTCGQKLLNFVQPSDADSIPKSTSANTWGCVREDILSQLTFSDRMVSTEAWYGFICNARGSACAYMRLLYFMSKHECLSIHFGRCEY